MTSVIGDTQRGKRQQAYKTEIIGGVVVHTPIQVTAEEAKPSSQEIWTGLQNG